MTHSARAPGAHTLLRPLRPAWPTQTFVRGSGRRARAELLAENSKNSPAKKRTAKNSTNLLLYAPSPAPVRPCGHEHSWFAAMLRTSQLQRRLNKSIARPLLCTTTAVRNHPWPNGR